MRRLRGGQTAVTHAICVESPGDRRHWIVLRRWCSPPPPARPRARALAEHATLSALEGADIPAPRPLWLDAEGRVFGVPATMQTRLPGRTHWPEAIPAARAAQLGQALARIHECRPPREVPSSRSWVEAFLAAERPPPPFAGTHHAAGAIWAVLRSVGLRAFEGEDVLLHADFHAGNTLWRRGRLSGVVDWETVEAGPRGRDLGYARLDCTLTGGPAMAAALTEGYGGETRQLWFWELLAALEAAAFHREWLPAWRTLGLTDLSLRMVRARLDAFVVRALAAADRAP